MSEFRSEAELFVTEFLDYVEKYDIFDEFDKRSQKMVRSAGVNALVLKAEKVFPPRVKEGKKETDKLDSETLNTLVTDSENVVDRRDVFSRKIQTNGAAKGLLARVLAGDKEAIELGKEFIKAENGEKEFDVSSKV